MVLAKRERGCLSLGEDRQGILGTPMHLKKDRVTQASQTITLELPPETGHVGVVPRSLLIDCAQGTISWMCLVAGGMQVDESCSGLRSR